MDTVEIAPNGAVAQPHDLQAPVLQAGALRRLQRLQQRLEGASEVAQVAVDAHARVRGEYQAAFEAACEDAGIAIPPGEQTVEIDWQTGVVGFRQRD